MADIVRDDARDGYYLRSRNALGHMDYVCDGNGRPINLTPEVYDLERTGDDPLVWRDRLIASASRMEFDG